MGRIIKYILIIILWLTPLSCNRVDSVLNYKNSVVADMKCYNNYDVFQITLRTQSYDRRNHRITYVIHRINVTEYEYRQLSIGDTIK